MGLRYIHVRMYIHIQWNIKRDCVCELLKQESECRYIGRKRDIVGESIYTCDIDEEGVYII